MALTQKLKQLGWKEAAEAKASAREKFRNFGKCVAAFGDVQSQVAKAAH